MIVMAIILVLVGLLFAGMKQLRANAAHSLTIEHMEVLNGMLSNLDAAGHNQFVNYWFMDPTPPGIVYYACANAYGNVTVDVAPLNSSNLPIADPPPPYTSISNGNFNDSLIFSGNATAVGYNNRWQAIDDQTSGTTYLNTAGIANVYPPGTPGIMQQLVTIPDNANGLGKIVTSEVAPFKPIAGVTQAAGTTYPSVLLDGWGNPIIFVPASGLQFVYRNLNYSTNPPTVPAGTPAFPALPPTIVSPDGRPFWASAGPDGDFIRGDDNIYSFNAH
jgi:hypothetical protein